MAWQGRALGTRTEQLRLQSYLLARPAAWLSSGGAECGWRVVQMAGKRQRSASPDPLLQALKRQPSGSRLAPSHSLAPESPPLQNSPVLAPSSNATVCHMGDTVQALKAHLPVARPKHRVGASEDSKPLPLRVPHNVQRRPKYRSKAR